MPGEGVPATPDIAANLAAVKDRIAAAARDADRDPATIELVAVTKTHPPDRIWAAITAGHRLFGENRVQEAVAKWPELRDAVSDLRLHLLGPLQTNKIQAALGLFDVIETVDRPRLAMRLADAMAHTGRRPNVFIQVNTGEEPQKSGILPAEADTFIRACQETYGLPVIGLMCVPPIDEEPSLHFALLREMAQRNGLRHLSMGMSADYPIAIAFGATLVRVGTGIFGDRPPASVT